MIAPADIAHTAAAIGPYIRRTPIIRLAPGELGLPFPLTLKLEHLQHSGSFKARGAFSRLLAAAPGIAGVIAASGGNHGAAVAYAAHRLGLRAEIFVPVRTPQAKLDRIAQYGARVVLAGSEYAEAYAASQQRQAETGAVEVHAYDQAEVLAGQGTVGHELQQQAPELTHVLVAVGGGGLIGGIAACYAGAAEIVAVEPALCPALHAAREAGRPVPVAVSGLAADSLGARQAGALAFEVAQRYVGAAVLVSDAEIAAAQALLWDRLRLVLEPGGATALAGVLAGTWSPPAAAQIGVVLCGGNVDPASITAAGRFT